MLHIIAHYGMFVASGFCFLCVSTLLIGIGAFLGDPTLRKRKDLIWEVPGVIAFLAAFWGAVAYGLHLL